MKQQTVVCSHVAAPQELSVPMSTLVSLDPKTTNCCALKGAKRRGGTREPLRPNQKEVFYYIHSFYMHYNDATCEPIIGYPFYLS